jgi:hypothetical protein
MWIRPTLNRASRCDVGENLIQMLCWKEKKKGKQLAVDCLASSRLPDFLFYFSPSLVPQGRSSTRTHNNPAML